MHTPTTTQYSLNSTPAPPPWSSHDNIKRVLSDIDRITGRPVVFLDFEFNHSSHQTLNLVCASLQGSRENLLQLFEASGEVREFWLHYNTPAQDTLTDLLEDLRTQNTILVGYGAAAEARSLLALGIDPHQFDWIDLYAEWRQLTFNNYACQYGTYYTSTGYKRKSVPPHFDTNRNKGKDNNEIGLGLVDCVGQMFEVFIDSIHKTEMRDLIISADRERIEQNKEAIQNYCTSDVYPLPFVFYEQTRRLCKATGMTHDQALQARLKRGQFLVSVSKMEQEGFPLNVEACYNLRDNFEQARNSLILNLVENHYPFYRRDTLGPKTIGLLGDWVDDYDAFVQFLVEKHPHLIKDWPRTIDKKTGKSTERLCLKDDVLENYNDIPEIRAYQSTKKNIKQLAWFKEPGITKKKKSGDFFDNVGPDGRLRAFLGAYGTQTSRNAPKASRFVLAMSKWLRCLVVPPEGWVIVAIDYASQEFAIAAVMSGDPSMIQAYKSGDPYLYFAKKAGAVPREADPKKCKNPISVLWGTAKIIDPSLTEKEFYGHGCPRGILEAIQTCHPEIWAEYQNYLSYEQQRNLFKSTTLGLQYGMGALKLSKKLTADMGVAVSVKEAEKLISLHQKTYPKYWQWLKNISDKYERAGCLILRDGWALLGDNKNFLSVRNFPVQGTGAVIMREAVRLLHLKQIRILAPLHDALYTICREEEVEEVRRIQSECMLKAVSTILGDSLEIRLDIDVHTHSDVWVEKQGRKYYAMLSKYLKPQKGEESPRSKLKKTIFTYSRK